MSAHTYDWPDGRGFWVAHPAHAKQQAYNMHQLRPMTWTTRYASLTFHMVDEHDPHLPAKDITVNGINTQGLSVALLSFKRAQYHTDPHLPGINSTQWLQWLLDQCASVSEAMTKSADLNLEPTLYHHQPAKVHLAVSDASGHFALLEWQHGRLQNAAPQHLAVATNHTPRILRQMPGSGRTFTSHDRYMKAAAFLNTKHLSLWPWIHRRVSQPLPSTHPTLWQVVHDLQHVRTTWQVFGEQKRHTLSIHDWQDVKHPQVMAVVTPHQRTFH